MNALVLFEHHADVVHSIEAVERMTQVPRHAIGVYCRRGLIRPVEAAEFHGWFFDNEAIRTIRRIEYLQRARRVNLEGVRIIFDLLAQIERLERELRFFREG